MVYLVSLENQSLVWETLSNESVDRNIIVSCQDKLMLSNGNKVEILSSFLVSGPYSPLPKKADKCPLILAGITQVRNHSSPCGFTYIWDIEDLIEIMLFNVINIPLLKEKNTLANELRDVGHLTGIMEKLTARCLVGGEARALEGVIWRAELCPGPWDSPCPQDSVASLRFPLLSSFLIDCSLVTGDYPCSFHTAHLHVGELWSGKDKIGLICCCNKFKKTIPPKSASWCQAASSVL